MNAEDQNQNQSSIPTEEAAMIGQDDEQEVYEDNRGEGEVADEPMEDADDDDDGVEDDEELANEQYGNDGDGDGDGGGDENQNQDQDEMQQDSEMSNPATDASQQVEFKDSSIAAFYNHRKSLFSISLHPTFPSPPLCLSGGEDERALLWDTRDGEEVFKFEGHSDSVTAVGWNANGEMLASAGMDGRVRVWKLKDSWKNWELICNLEGPDEVVWMTWHPTGNVLVVGASDSTVWMWHLPSGNVMNVFSGHTGPVTCGAFTADGKKLITASEDNSLIIWDPRSTNPLAKLQEHDSRFRMDGGITSLTVSPDNKVAIVGGANGDVKVINIGNLEKDGQISVVSSLEGHSNGESIEGIAFVDLLGSAGPSNSSSSSTSATSSNNVITISTEGKGIVWDLSNQKMRCEIYHDSAITNVKVHPKSHLFSTSSSDHTIKTWDSRNGACLHTHHGFTDGVLALDVGVDDGFTQGKETGGVGAYAEKGLGWKLVGAGDEGVALVFRA